jgi:hypothetical protein
MNEQKLKELWWKARIGYNEQNCDPEVLEKFAELIVRECIQNIRDNMEHARVDTLGDKDLFLETLRTSGHFYITELERHFGVEL